MIFLMLYKLRHIHKKTKYDKKIDFKLFLLIILNNGEISVIINHYEQWT